MAPNKYPDAKSTYPDDVATVTTAQEELKEYLRRAVNGRYPLPLINQGVTKIISEAYDILKTPGVKEIFRTTLLTFANRVLGIYFSIFGRLTVKELRSIAAVAEGKQSAEQEKTAQNAVKRGAMVLPSVTFESVSNVDKFDPFGYNMQTASQEYFKEYQRRVRKKLEEIATMQARPDYDSRVNLRNIAEMSVRYDNQLQMISNLKEKGSRLVWIEPHANCSKRCQPWQGRLYSLDGSTGTTEDGIKYIPLETATEITVTTKSGKIYTNGCITGYNCRHKLIPYTKGYRPQNIPAKIISQQRSWEQQQREYEREIRRAKTLYRISRETDPTIAKKALGRSKRLNAEYIAFSNKHNMPIVRERTRVWFGENLKV